MKTAEEKAIAFADETYQVDPTSSQFVKAVTLLLKEQDRDTRHACAEAVLDCETKAGDHYLTEAHNACMNVKAV